MQFDENFNIRVINQMATLEQLMQEFTQIFAGSSTTSIKASEQRLLQFEKDSNFLQFCTLILEEPQIVIQVKKLVAVYLQKYSKRVTKQKNQQKTINTIHKFLAIISSAKISIEIKHLVSSALETQINLQVNRALKMELTLKLIGQLRESIIQSNQTINFTYLIFCGKAIFGNHSFDQETTDFIKNTFKEYTLLNIRLLNIASAYSLQSKESLILIYKILRESSSLLKNLIKRMGVLDIEATKLLYLPELQLCITTALTLNIVGNTTNNSLFIFIEKQYQISRIINSVKMNYVNCISTCTRSLNTFVKHANLISSNPLYQKLGSLLDYFIKSTSSLIESTPIHALPSQSGLMQSLDQLFNLYVTCLRINDFYQLFSQNKNDLIQKIALPCLALTPLQAASFYDDTQQFIQFSLQVVDRVIKPAGYKTEKNVEEDENFVRQYQTLKTYAAEFLSSLCKYQDGTLTHIYEHALAIIQNKINSIYSKSTMLIVLACLRDHLKERKDLKTKIGQVFMLLFEGVPIPVVQQNCRKDVDIEYAYLLLAISRMIVQLKLIYPQIIDQAFKIGITILQSPSTSQVHKSFVLDIFDEIVSIDQGQKYILDIVTIYNHLLATCTQISLHLLDSYFDLVKHCADYLKANPHSTLQGLKILTRHIEKQVKKTEPVQIIINKCWNVIREVGEATDFIPDYIPELEEIIMPLVPYIDGIKNLDFQEDILLLMTAFIDKGKRVTRNQQKMFEIIPKIYYNQYCCRFGHAFHTIQLFIYYGSQTLKNSPQAIQAIIQMSISSMTLSTFKNKTIDQSENCQGAMILQSLIAKCGGLFPLQMWSNIIKAILNRLDRKVKFAFLSSNLYALLAMSLIHSYKFFSDEQNEILLTRILTNVGVFVNVEYSPKVIVVALTELLMLYSVPFVARRFSQILDITISLLQLSSNGKKQNLFGQQEEDQQKQYCNSTLMLKNDMKSLDEFNYFKKKIEELKNQNRQILVNSIAQFPKAKKDFFVNILTIEKVANVPRKIYKIKK